MRGRIAICPFITHSVNRVVSRSQSPRAPFTYHLKRPFSVSPNDHHLPPRATSLCYLKEQTEGSRRGCLASTRHDRVKECHPERKPRGLLFFIKEELSRFARYDRVGSGCLAMLAMTGWRHDRLVSGYLAMFNSIGWGGWHSRVGDGRGVYKQALANCCLFQ